MIKYDKIKIDGLDIFYREAGMRNLPAILLLHGFPASSHMFRRLIPALQDRFHLIAPDYPGFGNSSMPAVDEFEYSFDNIANIVGKFIEKMGLEKFGLYLMDYGAPVGFRIAVNEPERIESLIIQNGNAYEEGLREFWIPLKKYWKDPTPENEMELRKFLTLESTIWQYTNGVRDIRSISPDNWNMDQSFLDRPGNDLIQLRLFYDYRTNPPAYPEWQDYMRKHQPPALIVWGKNDLIFPAEGAYPFKNDLENIDFNLLDTGHFALEEDCEVIADKIIRFYDTRVAPTIEAPKAEAR
ncbi:hydrolase [Methanocella sp. CWC-04]|uniref:Hydrolase n=1 Tax=Methanooceanicella nereidis TaxID=2052831 RepID=A0AAP2REL2_9EURY|nr:alpha/beta hydrolase [Methanocella sp. CWC-04]MCD1295883.1 hydrolase [Methanocella sp. CWC-04]